MYLINYDKFIEQAIPPHWRDKWQHHVIATLCVSLKSAFDKLYQMRVQVLEEVDDNLQVAVFEAALNQLNGFAKRQISVSQGSENGAIKIITPANELMDEQVNTVIRKHFKRVKVAGMRIEFENESI